MQLSRVSFYIKPDENFYAVAGIERFLEEQIRYLANCIDSELYQLHVEASLPFYEDSEMFDYLKDENCDLALLERLFPTEPAGESLGYPWEIKSGQQYQHFKGKLVKIITIAQHTENPSQRLVVYEELYSKNQWVRPLEMFCSRVDKGKYPDKKQEWRFELVGESM